MLLVSYRKCYKTSSIDIQIGIWLYRKGMSYEAFGNSGVPSSGNLDPSLVCPLPPRASGRGRASRETKRSVSVGPVN